jgi:heme exporter protein A
MGGSISSLVVRELSCVRGGRLVFRDLSFAVEAGSLLVVEGANGSGKTSLLRTLAGFIPPASGAVVLNGGSEALTDAEDRAREIGWLGHQDAAKSQLTPSETLEFFARLYGRPSPPPQSLAEVGLGRVAAMPCQYLSAGQKKRLALARLRGGGRPLWLMDEPLASLDEDGKALALRFIGEHCSSGGIAVVATHESISHPCSRLRLGA